ncbi:MAG: hypothetical protein Q9166_001343 [cf. Caloplaca sp. 2 TL-2023]
MVLLCMGLKKIGLMVFLSRCRVNGRMVEYIRDVRTPEEGLLENAFADWQALDDGMARIWERSRLTLTLCSVILEVDENGLLRTPSGMAIFLLADDWRRTFQGDFIEGQRSTVTDVNPCNQE